MHVIGPNQHVGWVLRDFATGTQQFQLPNKLDPEQLVRFTRPGHFFVLKRKASVFGPRNKGDHL